MAKKLEDERPPERPAGPQSAEPNPPAPPPPGEPAAALQPGSKNPPPSRPRRKRPRKRVRLGDAMRKVGLDEHAIAENYAGVVEKLTTGQQIANAEKLLVDVLKECTRVLELPPRAGSASSDVPVVVHLNHNVPRPGRESVQPAATVAQRPASSFAMDALTAEAAEEGERRSGEPS